MTDQIDQLKDEHPGLSNLNVDDIVTPSINVVDVEKISNEIWFGSMSTDLENYEKQIIKSNKHSVSISLEEIDQIKTMLRILNIPFFQAKGEADALCAGLYNAGLISSCLTNDMDLLAFGCQKIIQIQSDKKVIKIDLAEILKKLDLTMDQFIDMCILFGSDYVSYSPRLNPEEI